MKKSSKNKWSMRDPIPSKAEVKALLSKPLIATRIFTGADDFEAYQNACNYLTQLGFSVGRMQAHSPIGIMYGDQWDIQKWRNLSTKERLDMHGTLEGNMRRGPVELRFYDLTEIPPEALERISPDLEYKTPIGAE